MIWNKQANSINLKNKATSTGLCIVNHELFMYELLFYRTFKVIFLLL